jgi:hypothetical protein
VVLPQGQQRRRRDCALEAGQSYRALNWLQREERPLRTLFAGMTTDRPECMSHADFNALMDPADPFTRSIRGLQAVEEVLDLAISESLANPHHLEISRLPFALKIDVASALGVIVDVPLFEALNRIRNRFAHDRHATFSERDATDLFNIWPEALRGTDDRKDFGSPADVLGLSLAWLFVLLKKAVGDLRDGKARVRISHEIAEEALGRTGLSLEERVSLPPVEETAAARLEQAREERRQQGLL